MIFRMLYTMVGLWAAILPAVASGVLPFPGPGLPVSAITIGTPVTLGSTVMSAAARSSATHTTTAAIPAGSLVVITVLAPFSSAQTISSVSDGTNSYTAAVTNAFDASTQLVAAIYYKENASAVGSGATITITFSGNTIAQPTVINAAYVTGILASGSLDKTSSGLLAPGTAYASGSTGTLTSASEIAFGFLGEYNANVSITEGSGFTTISSALQGSGGFFNGNLAFQKVSATTALNYQPSTSGSTFGKALIATFRGPPIQTPVMIGNNNQSTVTNLTMTTTAGIPAGSLALVFMNVSKNSTISVSSLTDGTNTYTRAKQSGWNTNTFVNVEVWYKENAAAVAAGATINATLSTTSGVDQGISAAYVVGASISGALDKSSSSATGAACPLPLAASGSTGTLSQTNEIVFNVVAGYGNAGVTPTITPSSGFSSANYYTFNTRNLLNVDYQIVNSTSALNPQPTIGTSTSFCGDNVVVTFKGN